MTNQVKSPKTTAVTRIRMTAMTAVQRHAKQFKMSLADAHEELVLFGAQHVAEKLRGSQPRKK